MSLLFKCQEKCSFLRKGPTILGQKEYLIKSDKNND
jgi:hypothetical protein